MVSENQYGLPSVFELEIGCDFIAASAEARRTAPPPHAEGRLPGGADGGYPHEMTMERTERF
jgi:hypothetical protein